MDRCQFAFPPYPSLLPSLPLSPSIRFGNHPSTQFSALTLRWVFGDLHFPKEMATVTKRAPPPPPRLPLYHAAPATPAPISSAASRIVCGSCSAAKALSVLDLLLDLSLCESMCESVCGRCCVCVCECVFDASDSCCFCCCCCLARQISTTAWQL